jgi:hypothetical protein
MKLVLSSYFSVLFEYWAALGIEPDVLANQPPVKWNYLAQHQFN